MRVTSNLKGCFINWILIFCFHIRIILLYKYTVVCVYMYKIYACTYILD